MYDRPKIVQQRFCFRFINVGDNNKCIDNLHYIISKSFPIDWKSVTINLEKYMGSLSLNTQNTKKKHNNNNSHSTHQYLFHENFLRLLQMFDTVYLIIYLFSSIIFISFFVFQIDFILYNNFIYII